MLLARVCFCLCFIGIIPGPELICRLFYFSFVFFLTQLLLIIVVAMFAHCAHLAGVPFLSFGRVFGDRWFLFAFVRMHAWYMWRLEHVLCDHFSICRFFGKTRPNMMCREISRPPGPPNHACLRPAVPILPHFVISVHHCTRTHRHMFIYTHLHPYIPSHINSYVFKIVSCFQIYIVKVY